MPGRAFSGEPFKFIWVVVHGGAARYGKKQKTAEADFHIDFKRPVHRAVGHPLLKSTAWAHKACPPYLTFAPENTHVLPISKTDIASTFYAAGCHTLFQLIFKQLIFRHTNRDIA